MSGSLAAAAVREKVRSYLEQSPVLADEPLWVVLAGLHGRLDQRGERLGERCLLLQREVLLLVFALATDFQHAGLLEERARRDDRFAVALFLLSGCCWGNKAKVQINIYDLLFWDKVRLNKKPLGI